jgi:hypothetical protein
MTSIVLDVDAAMNERSGPHPKQLTLSERILALGAWLDKHPDTPVACLPVLPKDVDPQAVEAVVLIPPAQFIKRAETRAIGPGHKVAALAWRDAAVAFTTHHPNVPIYTALQAVPLLQLALGVNGGFLIRTA